MKFYLFTVKVQRQIVYITQKRQKVKLIKQIHLHQKNFI